MKRITLSNTLTLPNTLALILVGAVITSLIAGCSSESPEGTAYFVTIKYKHSGLPYAAWVSRWSPYRCNDKTVIGYDSEQETIFYEKLDTDKANDSKVMESKVIDINKCGAFYEVYKSVWVGKAPNADFMKMAKKEDIDIFSGEPVKPEMDSDMDVKYVLASMNKYNDIPALKETPVKTTKYTYKVEYRRDDYFRYESVIVRSDGVEVIRLKTRNEADELIKYLK